MISEQLKSRLENATRTVWEDYKLQHPHLAESIEEELDNSLVTEAVEVLSTDEQYAQLIKRTDTEASIAAIIAVIAPTVKDIIFGLITK